MRYPVLLVIGESLSGKTEWAKSHFKNPLELKVGALPFYPNRMRAFNRKKHDGLVLDGVLDMNFLADNQEKLQGKYDSPIEFASTPGGGCSFSKYLFKVPTIVTVNYSAKNLHYLVTHDWCSRADNLVVVRWPVP